MSEAIAVLLYGTHGGAEYFEGLFKNVLGAMDFAERDELYPADPDRWQTVGEDHWDNTTNPPGGFYWAVRYVEPR